MIENGMIGGKKDIVLKSINQKMRIGADRE